MISKNAIKVLGTIAGALLLFKIFNSEASNKDTSNQIDDENESAGNSGIALSYPLSNYNVWADEMQAAMFDLGTNEDALLAVFDKLKNIRDLLQLIKAFGIRTYYSFGIPQGDYNLAQWFTEELSQGYISDINAILQAKGINYQF